MVDAFGLRKKLSSRRRADTQASHDGWRVCTRRRREGLTRDRWVASGPIRHIARRPQHETVPPSGSDSGTGRRRERFGSTRDAAQETCAAGSSASSVFVPVADGEAISSPGCLPEALSAWPAQRRLLIRGTLPRTDMQPRVRSPNLITTSPAPHRRHVTDHAVGQPACAVHLGLLLKPKSGGDHRSFRFSYFDRRPLRLHCEDPGPLDHADGGVHG
jgi:hypothetical protein